MSQRARFLLSVVLISACGGEAATSPAPHDAGTESAPDGSTSGPSDGGAWVDAPTKPHVDGAVAEDFAIRVDQAVQAAQQSGNTNCATALPDTPVSDVAAMRQAIQDFVGRIAGPVDSVSYDAVACGGAGHADCATQFQHMLFKADGQLGTALLPLAQELEQGGSLEDASQTTLKGGLSKFVSVSIAGVRDGHLVGIVWFEGRRTCH